jgi:hypothetical protein
MKRVLLAAGAVALLGGCDDPKPQAPPRADRAESQPAGRPAAAMLAAEERLRARLRSEAPLALRAVQAHRQAVPDTLAICGQVNPSGRAEDPFIPFVAVIGFEGDRTARVEFHLGATSAEATRVYYELVDRCFDGGGPPNLRTVVRPLPPAPNVTPNVVIGEPAPPPTLPAQQVVPSQVVPSQVAPQVVAMPPAPGPQVLSLTPAGPAQGSVVTRQPANLRASPAGGGEVLRTVPRASSLQVFGEAPGGWFQVGEREPWGWIHGSMLER